MPNFQPFISISAPSSTRLATAAQQRLSSYSYIGMRELCCQEPNSGLITIQGTVSSYYHKQLAQEIVRRVEGVCRIDNQLSVRGLESVIPSRAM